MRKLKLFRPQIRISLFKRAGMHMFKADCKNAFL